VSGIAGIVTPDASLAPAGSLALMMAATAHRGPDGGREFYGGRVALGHQLLDVAGQGPSMGALVEADGCIVTADCRLDNRQELIAELGADVGWGDARLIIAAYRRWGDDMPNRLLGDFAFALWDAARGRLVCARDHLGVKPFYYAHSNGAFALSSEPSGVLACDWVEAGVNDDALARLLAGLAPQADETLQRNVRRLPPAHLATFERGRLETRRYWSLQPVNNGDEDAASGLRRHLEAAVSARLRGPVRAGAMLSGGLDSSSIATLAALLHRQATGEPLTTFSMVFDDTPDLNERPQIEAVLAAIDARPHFLPSNGVSHIACLPELLRQQNGPVAAPNLPASNRVYALARASGVNVVLDGHGGDEAVSSGVMWLRELAASGRWFTLWSALRSLSRHEGFRLGPSFWALFKAYAPVVQALRPLKAKRGDTRAKDERPANPSRFLQPAWAQRADGHAREAYEQLFGKAVNTEQAHHLASLASPLQAYALEVLDKAAAAAGVEARYPLLDKRVVEFCCSAPAAEKLKGGRTRSLIRRALAGDLPDPVRNRSDKFDFTPHLRAGLAAPSSPSLEALFAEGDDGLGDILHLDALRAASLQMLHDPDAATPLDAQAIWRFAALAAWWRSDLQRSAQRQPALNVT